MVVPTKRFSERMKNAALKYAAATKALSVADNLESNTKKITAIAEALEEIMLLAREVASEQGSLTGHVREGQEVLLGLQNEFLNLATFMANMDVYFEEPDMLSYAMATVSSEVLKREISKLDDERKDILRNVA